MKVVVLYHKNSDHGGIVEDYVRDYQRFKGHKLELMSLEKRGGAAMAALYDITRYPAVLALTEDGSVQNIWQGLPLPTMNELDAYTMQMAPESDPASVV